MAATGPESPAAREALRLKQAAREKANVVGAQVPAGGGAPGGADHQRLLSALQGGTFSNLDRIRLRWLSLKDTPDPNYFALIPQTRRPRKRTITTIVSVAARR